MTDYSDFKLAVETFSGGKNTVLVDKFGLPSVMVVVPQMSYKDVGIGEGTDPLPAFVLGGKEQPYFLIGKYLSSAVRSIPCSLPMRTKTAHNYETVIPLMQSKGTDWCLSTNAMYAAIALFCYASGFMPHGNNNYGSDSQYPLEKGIPSSIMNSDGRIGSTLTGSGPVSWNHNNDITGICDLNGNAMELCSGLRQYHNEINIIENNDAALSTTDHSVDSPSWRAIRADGSLTDPGDPDSIKLDWQDGVVTFTTKKETSYGGRTDFAHVKADDTLQNSIPELLYALALFPKENDNSKYGYDLFEPGGPTNEEWITLRGGHWYYGSHAGVFHLQFGLNRRSGTPRDGHRLGYVGKLQ